MGARRRSSHAAGHDQSEREGQRDGKAHEEIVGRTDDRVTQARGNAVATRPTAISGDRVALDP